MNNYIHYKKKLIIIRLRMEIYVLKLNNWMVKLTKKETLNNGKRINIKNGYLKRRNK